MPSSRLRFAAWAALAFLNGACTEPTGASPEPRPTGQAASQLARKPELVPVPGNVLDGRGFLQAEVEKAERDGLKLVVYVGAAWCEPCQAFHDALTRGDLDRELAGVRLLEFDLDRHGDLLEKAGCTSKLIPLFARPTPEGLCSQRRTEGGIKGDGAVRYMLPRLVAIL